MVSLAAAGLFVGAFTACSAVEPPAPPVVETVNEEASRERWRCEVPLRCFAIDPDTGKRTELPFTTKLWSDTALVRGLG